jgi:hypothetical protein
MEFCAGQVLPPELLLHIFLLSRHERLVTDFVPDPFLPKLALINKYYLEVARTALYTDVFLTQHGSLSCKDTVRGFLWTLQVQPSLVDRVQGIHYGATSIEEDETRHLSDAISRANNLLRLRIFGYEQDYSSLIRLKEAIESRRALQEFEISTFSLTRQYSSIFCLLVQFFDILLQWPDIRSVTLYPETVGWERAGTPLSISDVTSGACAQLKRFICRCAEYWQDRHLEALARIAPALNELVLSGVLALGGITKNGLSSTLPKWAPTLEVLRIHFPQSEVETGAYERFQLDAVITRLPGLRVLDLGSAYIRPRSLAGGLEKLETLRLGIRLDPNMDYVRELKDILCDAGPMPSLSELCIWPQPKLEFQDAIDIYVMCIRRRRRVSLEMVGDYGNVLEHLRAHPELLSG